jgi:hypothetical protein
MFCQVINKAFRKNSLRGLSNDFAKRRKQRGRVHWEWQPWVRMRDESPTLSKTESMGHPKTLSLRHPPFKQAFSD